MSITGIVFMRGRVMFYIRLFKRQRYYNARATGV